MVQMPTLGSMEPGPIDPGSLPTLVHDSLGAYLISLLYSPHSPHHHTKRSKLVDERYDQLATPGSFVECYVHMSWKAEVSHSRTACRPAFSRIAHRRNPVARAHRAVSSRGQGQKFGCVEVVVFCRDTFGARSSTRGRREEGVVMEMWTRERCRTWRVAFVHDSRVTA